MTEGGEGAAGAPREKKFMGFEEPKAPTKSLGLCLEKSILHEKIIARPLMKFRCFFDELIWVP